MALPIQPFAPVEKKDAKNRIKPTPPDGFINPKSTKTIKTDTPKQSKEQ